MQPNHLLKESIAKFCTKYIVSNTRKWDDDSYFPKELFPLLGELGVLGMVISENYGGTNLGYRAYVDAIVEVSKKDSSIGLSVAAHNSLSVNHIYKFGNEEQKLKYLPNLTNGKWVGAWALTEPDSGSDAGALKTTAILENDHYILNGTKNFITHGKSNDVIVVIAKTERGSSAFVIEQGVPGLSAGKVEDKLGMRASETAEVIFSNCKIPRSCLLGNEGEGFKQALSILDGGRISIAALSLGIAEGAYESALKYAKERVQFGKAIIQHQAIGFKLSEMATEIQAARLLVYHAADLLDSGERINSISAMAKLFASETAVKICNEALQIFGGYGFVKDFPVEKFYRDVRLCTIGEGTSEIQKLVILREL